MTQAEEQLFQHIYSTYRIPLHRYLAKRTGDDSEAADLAQETFVRMYEKRVQPETAKAWLFKTGYHLFIDQWRKKRRTPQVPLESIPDMPVVGGSPEVVAVGAELRSEISQALSKLKARDRQVLLMLLNRGLTYKEIADHFGVTENAIKTLVHRARKRMRELMEA
ncbi:RNA polymerase sigma factor [Paenibacillus ginsengarvi]|uniref:RNA polymerase sigma factor n=1 Tax=Paenibacillus ginsengarvi TaxID=400777 RepID=A0A3B0CM93_9BACL|nr:RNA polymerase sigma factor [Paenibacillus ginsengarvi]RKN85991.1 RNA polymerase sigma factor [Paenibacillus ginsengarvi]